MEARRTTRIDCLATDHDDQKTQDQNLDRGGPSHGRKSKRLHDSTSERFATLARALCGSQTLSFLPVTVAHWIGRVWPRPYLIGGMKRILGTTV